MYIAIISVAPPFRGGIAKHTSILYKELSAKHSVDIINYSRQYPDFIFPGNSQYLEDSAINKHSELCIDSINPLTWYRTGKLLSKREYDLIIFLEEVLPERFFEG